jgi:hypothetical protein
MVTTFNKDNIIFRNDHMKTVATYSVYALEFLSAGPDATQEELDAAKFEISTMIPGTVLGGGAKDAVTVIVGGSKLGNEKLNFALLLRGVGNPDYQQYSDIAPTITVLCADREQATAAIQSYKTIWDLGGGNFGGGCGEYYQIAEEDGTPLKSPHFVGRFTYSGRLLIPGEKWFGGPAQGKRKLTLKGVI